ncbi:ABC transporter permease [Thiohalobacter sp. IOR34]|uniref:ABC transporter permease n=1 Tax=Thiohalobacter sp. IOR34 TaxID=3057176 RepID=UPI0025B1D612|nr:ABC transporter permease [Thiohalobacter sp. IOR34]WJW75410.1 ABC transporter permease [Thiohalobacter sp. IOR34]
MTPREKYIAFQTILIREVLRYIRIWVQTVLPPVITTALYFIIFGNLIGSQIGDMAGFRYMDYIVPGLIMMSVITNSYANVVSSFYGSKFQRHIEEMLVAPVPNYLILTGFIAGGVARGLTVGAAVTLTAAFFSPLQVEHPAVALSMVLLTAILFSIGGLINGVYAKSFDDISIIPTFVLTPLTYLGGIFYSIDMLPGFWQQVSLANPILYMINSFRYGMLGVSDIDVGLSYAIVIGFIVVMFGFALGLLNRGVGIRS